MNINHLFDKKVSQGSTTREDKREVNALTCGWRGWRLFFKLFSMVWRL